jgi:hypothetical protein
MGANPLGQTQRTAKSGNSTRTDHHGIPYSDLCFMMDNRQVRAHIYIEDAPDNIQSLRTMICFANSQRGSWCPAQKTDEVYKLIKAHEETLRANKEQKLSDEPVTETQ